MILWTILCWTCSLRLAQAQGKETLGQGWVNLCFSVAQVLPQMNPTNSVGKGEIKIDLWKVTVTLSGMSSVLHLSETIEIPN